jgi:hypothetical protein
LQKAAALDPIDESAILLERGLTDAAGGTIQGRYAAL